MLTKGFKMFVYAILSGFAFGLVAHFLAATVRFIVRSADSPQTANFL
jgi:hypothetical protein